MPSAPLGEPLEFITANSVRLSWRAPKENPERTTAYRILWSPAPHVLWRDVTLPLDSTPGGIAHRYGFTNSHESSSSSLPSASKQSGESQEEKSLGETTASAAWGDMTFHYELHDLLPFTQYEVKIVAIARKEVLGKEYRFPHFTTGPPGETWI